MRRARAWLAATGLVALTASGCAHGEGIARVVDGRAVEGPYVASEAYAAYLRGAIAEASGDLAGAAEGYSIAVALGPMDPEPWVRLARARCAREPRDPKADEALEHALAIDDRYAPAWAVKAECARHRGDVRVAFESATRATALDAADAAPLALLADADPTPASDALRARLAALTLLHGSDVAAWDALASWARRRGDAALEGHAVAHVAALAPSRGAEVDAVVLRLEGEGRGAAARRLARARAESLQGASIDARVARLAIDEALSSGAAEAARRVATRTHVPLVVVAARSLLAGDAQAARGIAAEVLAADPRSAPAAMVLAAAADVLGEGSLVTRALRTLDTRAALLPGAAAIPPEVWLTYARTISRGDALDGAQAVLRALPREPILAGDPVMTPIAVALAARGIVDPSDLDANARVELAERRGEVVDDAVSRAADPRHRLLALARRAPRDPATTALAARLAPARSEDAVVAAAAARLALAVDPASVPGAAAVLSRFDPADPLVASAVFDCALRSGDARAIPLARRRLAAVAGTPAERARLIE